MKLKLNQKLLEQRELLQRISQLSYTYAKLNQNYKGGDLTDQEAKQLISVYDNLLDKIISLAEEIENEKKDSRLDKAPQKNT